MQGDKKPRKWDEFEVALLIKTYVFIYLEGHDKKTEVDKLSYYLRKYAVEELGIKIDNVYRNSDGITMKLANIEYLFSNGEHGLSSYSSLDEKTYHMYLEDKVSYNTILQEAEILVMKSE